MTVDATNEQPLDEVQKGLENLDIEDAKKTNVVKRNLPPRKCVGRCVIGALLLICIYIESV